MPKGYLNENFVRNSFEKSEKNWKLVFLPLTFFSTFFTQRSRKSLAFVFHSFVNSTTSIFLINILHFVWKKAMSNDNNIINYFYNKNRWAKLANFQNISLAENFQSKALIFLRSRVQKIWWSLKARDYLLPWNENMLVIVGYEYSSWKKMNQFSHLENWNKIREKMKIGFVQSKIQLNIVIRYPLGISIILQHLCPTIKVNN